MASLRSLVAVWQLEFAYVVRETGRGWIEHGSRRGSQNGQRGEILNIK